MPKELKMCHYMAQPDEGLCIYYEAMTLLIFDEKMQH